MKATDCRAFIMAKSGLSQSASADSISWDQNLGRFAIADGVTQSYFPQFFSRALTKSFVERTDPASVFFKSPEITKTFNKVVSEWDNQALEAEQNADSLTKALYDERRYNYPYGASTFAAVTLHDNRIEVVGLGDSCVFLIPDNPDLPATMITSMPHSDNSDPDLPAFNCKFGSRPHCINTGGYLSTSPVTESISPGACWILMMTDALAEWFVGHFDRYDESGALKSLLDISNQEEFEDFINSRRVDEIINDDDTSLLIARIEPCNQMPQHESKKIYLPWIVESVYDFVLITQISERDGNPT